MACSEMDNALGTAPICRRICDDQSVFPAVNRILRSRLLYRRKYDLDAGIDFIVDQLQGPGKDHGYRWMYTKCKQRGISIRKEDVRILLSLLDPIGSQVRQTRRLRRRQYFAQGPNFVWHIDSYDKLKPYGICTNGCIDGFSRNIIWLTNLML